MTKFELPEKPKKTNTSEDFNNLRKAVDELDKFDYTWKTYANKDDRRINAANKYIEELERENQRLIAENLGVKTSVDNAKQQQALPVVPECVARDIEKLKSFNKDGKNFHIFDLSYYSEESINWVEYDYDNYVKFYLAVATSKYQVEKPQLFYLKAKELLVVGDYDHVEDLWLDWNKNFTPKKQDAHKFTQQEIDSMQTGSYE